MSIQIYLHHRGTTMSKITKLGMILLYLALFIPLSAVAAGKINGQDNSLFVLLAKRGHIQSLMADKKIYRLTLKDVNPNVIYFLDRPARKTGQIALDGFIKQWKTGTFKNVPPNAVIEVIRLYANHRPERKHSVSYVVVLTNPNYNKAKNSLTFDIKALPGSKTPIPKVADSDYVAAFIDSGGCGPCMLSNMAF